MTELADKTAQKNSQRGTLRKQKGWIGFVHGYAERSKVFDRIWHKIKWGKPEESGAKEIVTEGNKTIYKF